MYRDKSEVPELRSRDPIDRLKTHLLSECNLTVDEVEALECRAREVVDDAYAYARASAFRRRKRLWRTCLNRLQVVERFCSSAQIGEGECVMNTMVKRMLTGNKAMAEAIAQEMERDPSVFVLGEDVGAYGGIFGSTEGLFKKFGASRVLDTPISETAFIGAAIGAAAEGMRPIVELMFVDFFGVCMDQIYNHMAKITTCPAVE